MSYIFGKLWHSAIIWPIRESFQCILQGVRFLMANQTLLSGTSDNESYHITKAGIILVLPALLALLALLKSEKNPSTSPWQAADFLNVTALTPFVCYLWAALWPFDPFVPHNTLPESRGSNSSWKSARPQNMLASQKAKIQSHPETCSHLRKLKIKATRKHVPFSES